MTSPSPNGRDRRGRFAAGNSGGPGNPLGRQTGLLRSALLAAITEADIRSVALALIKRAKSGDTGAIRELFDRAIGKPQEADFIARLEALETSLADRDREMGGEP